MGVQSGWDFLGMMECGVPLGENRSGAMWVYLRPFPVASRELSWRGTRKTSTLQTQETKVQCDQCDRQLVVKIAWPLHICVPACTAWSNQEAQHGDFVYYLLHLWTCKMIDGLPVWSRDTTLCPLLPTPSQPNCFRFEDFKFSLPTLHNVLLMMRSPQMSLCSLPKFHCAYPAVGRRQADWILYQYLPKRRSGSWLLMTSCVSAGW